MATSCPAIAAIGALLAGYRLRRSGAYFDETLAVARWLAAIAVLPVSQPAQAQQRAQYETLVAKHAKANLVPEALVHRVIVRESKYQPDLVGRGGTIGLMQIKLATARGLGYSGDAEGLRDPDTNLTYAREISRRRLSRRQWRSRPRRALLCQPAITRSPSSSGWNANA